MDDSFQIVYFIKMENQHTYIYINSIKWNNICENVVAIEYDSISPLRGENIWTNFSYVIDLSILLQRLEFIFNNSHDF